MPAQKIVIYIVAICGALLAVVITRVILGLVRRVRRRRAGRLHPRLQPYAGPDPRLIAERRRQAARILATSSTGQIPGYQVLQQVEAVYVDGFRRPEEAIEGLKATAALKGANALINVRHEHSTTGRHAASGDAVVVRKLTDARLDRPAGPAESANAGGSGPGSDQ
ncbi:MAG: hypothetical protein ACE5K7_00215 [Phycisphaerae bacterium]